MTPEMLRTLSNAWTHLCTHTLAQEPPATAVALLKTPACRTAETTVNRVAKTGDVPATVKACNVWVRAVAQAVQEHTTS